MLSERGFSFLELALALVVLGLIAGAGLLLFGKTTQSALRSQTGEHMEWQKKSLLYWARHNGALPCSTTATNPANDGYEFSPGTDRFPYVRLGISPNDAWGNAVRYSVATSVAHCTDVAATRIANQNTICRNLRDATVVAPEVYYSASGVTAGVPAVLKSGAERDLDNNDGLFDILAGRTNVIANSSNAYDDLVTAITHQEVYQAVRDGGYCAYEVLVRNCQTTAPTADVVITNALRTVGIVGVDNCAAATPMMIRLKIALDDQLQFASAAPPLALFEVPVVPATPTMPVSCNWNGAESPVVAPYKVLKDSCIKVKN